MENSNTVILVSHVSLIKTHSGTLCVALLFDSAVLNFQGLLFRALKTR